MNNNGYGYLGSSQSSNNDPKIPQFVIIEGKKDNPFDIEDENAERTSGLFNDVPDWSEVMHRIEDKQDAMNGLLTFGTSHCKNVNIRA